MNSPAQTPNTAPIKRFVARKTGRAITADNHPYQERYRSDPAAFAHEVLGIDLAPYQIEIMRQFVERHRVAVRAPHGAGKTALSACLVLWAFAVFEDVKVITTASAWRQLVHFTWPEIRKWAKRANWKKTALDIRDGKELLTMSISSGSRQAFAAASDNPATLEGAHAEVVVAVFDEAKAIPVPIWDALEGAFSAGTAYALAISTPGDPSGRFYEISTRKPGYEDWAVRHITLAEAIDAGRINPEWVEQRRTQWGEKSAVFQNRVEGEFADSGENSVIPLRWVELANDRWRDCNGKGVGETIYGVDPAYKGEDNTSIARLVGVVLEAIEGHSKEDTMQTAGRVAAQITKTTPCGIDTIGVGAGVYDRLKEQGYAVQSVNASERTDLTTKGDQHYRNVRAYMWFAMREALDPDGDVLLALPPDDKLTGDLTAPTYIYLSDGRIQIESKDDIRERIGRSTDYGDAACMAYYVRAHRGVSDDDITRWKENKLNVDDIGDDLLEAMRASGMKIEKMS